jgi:hypothetical protein
VKNGDSGELTFSSLFFLSLFVIDLNRLSVPVLERPVQPGTNAHGRECRASLQPSGIARHDRR